MNRAGVIGWPVAHSKSPLIHRFWLDCLGLAGDYLRLPVPPDQLADTLAGLAARGLAGVNVTLPHKEAVIPHLDSLDPAAASIGAVNCITVTAGGRLHGSNTDLDGFLEPLDRQFPAFPDRAVVIGAGGAARAVLAGLARRGTRHLTLLNRSEDRACALLEALGLAGEVRPLGAPLPPAPLLVNASSLGMAGQPPLQVDLAPLPAEACVYDLVYAPLETPLLAVARARGLATIDGLAMLIGQAAPAFTRFFGRSPPRDRDAELRALLGAPPAPQQPPAAAARGAG